MNVAFMKVYCSWNVELSTAIIIVEVFFMIMFSYELRKEELLLFIVCFFFPVIAASIPWTTGSYGPSRFHTCGFKVDNDCDDPMVETIDDYISGTIITCICISAITVAMLRLAYRYLRLRFTNNAPGEHNLLDKRVRKYQNALKQTLPFAIYPVVSLVTLVIYYIRLITHRQGMLEYISLFVTGCTGAFSSGIFFVHVYLLGQERRNVFKYRRHIHKSVAAINEGQTLTSDRSMTWTHVTRTETPVESDMEGQYENGADI